MLKLYYFPQLCSLASHVALEETGAPYELQKVDILKGEQHRADYRAKNRNGQVPTLEIDGTCLTETVAILHYLAKAFPDARLAPADPADEARWLSAMARMSSGMHPTFTRAVRPDFIVDDKAAAPAVTAKAREKYREHLAELEETIGDQEWMLGSQYTTADSQALVFYNWGARAGFEVEQYDKLTRWKDRMLERPAVYKVLVEEESPLVQVIT